MSRTGPTLSVVIPCRNYGRYLAQAIDSVLAQSYPACQVLVVDDGSTDNTGEVARGYAAKIEYLKLPHSGISRVRNEGLRRARGEFIVFLDADDALDPHYLEKTLEAWTLAPTPKPAFVYTQRSNLESPSDVSRHPPFDRDRLKFGNYIMASALLQAGPAREVGYDPAFVHGLEDYDFYLGLVEKGYAGLLLDLPLIRVRLHPSSMTHRSGAPAARWELMRRILHKHRTLYSSRERRQFMRDLRAFMASRFAEQRDPAQPALERWATLRKMISYGLPAGALLSQMRFIARRPAPFLQENRHV